MQRRLRLRDIRRRRKTKGVRKKVRGTPERPRLSVSRSSKQIYVQAIDDLNGVTLAASSSLAKDVGASGTKTEVARAVGTDIAQRLSGTGVTKVVFDRGWYRYHGRIKALAEAARKGGLEF